MSGIIKTETLGAYYWLTKPGIVYGNGITAVAGFLFASGRDINPLLLLAMLAGTSLVIASACVFNNYIDRDIDAIMARTKWRALANGSISGRNALIYGTILGILGIAILVAYTNPVVVALGLVGWMAYVVLYGYTKRHSVHGTLVGTISGSTPILAGYTAATGHVDTAGLILFFVLVFWQMPHFFAIAIYRYDDYAAAKIPVLPVKKGLDKTKNQMLLYVAAFVVATLALFLLRFAGYVYGIGMAIIGVAWLRLAARGFKAADTTKWARQLFRFSLIVLLTFSLLISINAYVV